MVTIILPTKNEESCIGATIKRIQELCGHPRIVVVDGHSTDRTVEIANKYGLEVIYDHGLGKGEALRCAFDHVKDDVVFLDVDGTYPLGAIPQIVDALHEYDLVIGERMDFDGDALPRLFLVGDAISRGLFQLLYSSRLDNLSGLRGMSWQAIKKMELESDDFGIETEITAKAVRLGLKVKKIPITYMARTGTSKFRPVHDGMVVLRAMFKYRFKSLS
ncbi:MAG: glycosyltransferase [Methanosarcinales archaeon]|nr:glycosyltransferase [Methanosarcinales archaeon]